MWAKAKVCQIAQTFYFSWYPNAIKTFDNIKNIMARDVLLRYPNFNLPFHIYADASDYQIGAVITQKFTDGEMPIAFYSRKLNSAQKNYTTIEKELLSLTETAEAFRNILLGHKVHFYSDHKNLTFSNFKSERVKRWRLLTEEYDYDEEDDELELAGG